MLVLKTPEERTRGSHFRSNGRFSLILRYLLVTIAMLWCAILIINGGTATDFRLETFLFWMVFPLYGGIGSGPAETTVSIAISLALVVPFCCSIVFKKLFPFLVIYAFALCVDLFLGSIVYAFRNG